MTRAPDVTVVVTAHTEGLLLHRALRSVQRAVSDAEAASLTVEVLVVCDQADRATEDALSATPPSWRIERVDLGDPGAARNHGVLAATGDHVAFLDGDDIMAPRWLRLAHALATEGPEAARRVFHPETMVAFGDQQVIGLYESSDTPGFDPAELAEQNLWTTRVFARRALLLDVPFQRPLVTAGFHEDWHWSCELLAAGIHFRVVPRSVGYWRRRPSSMTTLRREGLFLATELFAPGRSPGAARGELTRATATQERPMSVADLRSRVEALGRQAVLRFPRLLPLARRARDYLRHLDSQFVEATLPEWLRSETQAVHDVEPALFPDRELAGSVRFHSRGHTQIGSILQSMLHRVGPAPTHILVAPWLKRGGADLETLNYVQALVELGQRPVVVLTEDTDSPWADRLPTDVPRIELGKESRVLDQRLRQQLLAMLLLQSRVAVVHNLNSLLAYEVLGRYGPALAAGRRLFASVFCEDVTPSGRQTGYVVTDVASVAPTLSGIFADNRRILTFLEEVFGLPAALLHVHEHPAPPSRAIPEIRHGSMTVLWAGRLDRQKRPDLLVEVARRCEGRSIRFVAYGYALLDPVVRERDLSGPNLEFRGGYDTFQALPLDEFDVFLNTSQWDGLPNILLEAMAAGLAVVSSGAGGIPELLGDGAGVLVAPFDDAEGYASALTTLLGDPDHRGAVAEAGQRRLAEGRTWQQFVSSVSSAPGYVSKL